MQRASLRWGVFFGLGLAAMVGCAVGTDALGDSDLATVTPEAGDEKSVALPTPSTLGDAATGADTGSGDPDGGTRDAAVDGAPPVVVCTSPNACLTASDLLSVSGDRNADVKTAQGAGSQWLKVRVTEDDNSVIGAALRAKIELQSPAGTNYDLYVYRASGESGQECSMVAGSSTSTGGSDSVSQSWGEGLIPNGSDDSRNLSVEVRWVSGSCAPGSKWTVTVRGNTN